MNPTNSLHSLSLFILIQMIRSSCSAPCGLQQGIVRTPPIVGLVQEDVEGLLIDSCLRELNLNVMQETEKNNTEHHNSMLKEKKKKKKEL